MDTSDKLLPPKPEEPLDSDCCGTGCTPCVFDIYTQELELWKKHCANLDGIQNSAAGLDKEDIITSEVHKEFEIVEIIEESASIFRYRFSLESHQKLPLTVGQHLVLRAKSSSGTLSRQYTPISDFRNYGYFDVSIKIYEDGNMSEHIKTWKVGNKVEWRGPYGKFDYTPNKYDIIVLLAAGTGIAPMIQVIRHILQNEDDDTMIRLFYSVKLYEDIMCKDMIDVWKDFWNFKVVFNVTQGNQNNTVPKYGEKIVYGRINKEQLQDELKSDIDSTYFCICGTKSFDKDMIKMLQSVGVTEEKYHKF